MTRLIARRHRKPWLVLALSLVVVSASTLAAEEAARAPDGGSFEVSVSDGNLTAEVVAAPLHEVMAEIGRLTGAEVRWLTQPGVERVSVQLEGVPLPEALARILGRNVALAYGAAGQVTGIWIAPRHGAEADGHRTPTPVGRSSVPDDGGAKPPTGRNQPRVEDHPGIGDAPVAQRESIEIAAQPPRVRMEAVELLAMHADRDEAARDVLLHVASMDADPQVRHIAAVALASVALTTSRLRPPKAPRAR
jgi:hypothetical protein